MGAVLAMKAWFGAVALMLGLAACGTDRGTIDTEILSRLSGLLQPRAEQPDLRQVLTPEVLASIDGPLLLVEIPDRDAEAGLQPIGLRNGHRLWRTGDGITMSFREGVLSSTRGLGTDLMSTDLDEVVRALRNRSGEAVRLHQYLDGEERIETRAFVCDYENLGRGRIETLRGAVNALHIQETCVTSDRSIQNDYWRSDDGVMRKSRQWVGPFIGYLTVEQIKDR